MSYYPRRVFPSEGCSSGSCGLKYNNNNYNFYAEAPRMPFNCMENFEMDEYEIIVIHMQSCGPCKYLLSQIKGINDVILIESRDPKAEKYKCEAYPTIIVQDKQGKVHYKEAGAKSRDEFLKFKDQWKK
jgi:hypothetical protein